MHDILLVVTVWMQHADDKRYRFVTLKPTRGVMAIELYQEVFLTRDLPDKRLRKGDIAVLIDYVHILIVGRGGQFWKSSMC